MKIIDAHTHVASLRYIPGAFVEGIVDNMMEQMRQSSVTVRRSVILDRMQAEYQDDDASVQLRTMDKLGIERAVLLLPDFTYALEGCTLSIAQMFAEHRALLERHPTRFTVFAGVDPRWGKDGLDLFIKGIEQFGFRGLKLYPPCGYRPDSPLLDPYYQYCEAYKLPVLIHMGPTSPVLSFNEAQPGFVDAPAKRYRNIPFILAHGAVNHAEQCIQLCKYRPNVYLDISGAQMPSDASELEQLFASGIGHKVIFGTDWPVNQARNIKGLLDLFVSSGDTVAARLSRAETELVLAGNIEHILAGSVMQ
ncbi:MAG TPA: amidohydrolase family protein [Steroidobacteraceae bacterium]